MSQNILLLCDASGEKEFAARWATRTGSDLGLVLTAIDLHREKLSGGRIEDEREYGGVTFNAFDEPVFIGSAIAQLAGHAEAVVVDSLDDWAARLRVKFGDNDIEIDSEISSLTSVMRAAMCGLLLLSRRADLPPPAAEVHRRILQQIDPCLKVIAELHGGSPVGLLRGSL